MNELFNIFIKITRFFQRRGIGKYPLIMKVYNFIYGRIIKGIVLIHAQGSKMYVDPKDEVAKSLITRGTHDAYQTELFRKLVKKGMITVDIGAHIGYYTLIAANIVGEDGTVFAFEPNPTNYNLLVNNLKINGYNNVKPIQKAVSDKVGNIKLFLSPEASGWHNIYNVHGWRDSIEVKTMTLDEFFKKGSKKIDLIKMDAEGAEMAILLGMKKIIDKNDKLIILAEFNPLLIKAAGYNPQQYLYEFMGHGFKIFDINEEKKDMNPIVDVAKFCNTYPDGTVTNLLCCKGFNGKLHD